MHILLNNSLTLLNVATIKLEVFEIIVILGNNANTDKNQNKHLSKHNRINF